MKQSPGVSAIENLFDEMQAKCAATTDSNTKKKLCNEFLDHAPYYLIGVLDSIMNYGTRESDGPFSKTCKPPTPALRVLDARKELLDFEKYKLQASALRERFYQEEEIGCVSCHRAITREAAIYNFHGEFPHCGDCAENIGL